MFTGRRLPQTCDDLKLLDEAIKAFPCTRRKWDAVGRVLGLVPSRSESQLNTSATHDVDLGYDNRQLSWLAKRCRADQGSQSYPPRIAGEAGKGSPHVSGAGVRLH